MKYYKILIFSLILLMLQGCGFEVVKQTTYDDLFINEISSSGDKNLNFKIKNKLQQKPNKNTNNPINLELETKKVKTIKEKNIKNQVTKYQLSISATVSLIVDGNVTNKTFTVQESGDYLVAGRFSKTLSNEKKLIKLLTDNLVFKINKKIIENTNDL